MCGQCTCGLESSQETDQLAARRTIGDSFTGPFSTATSTQMLIWRVTCWKGCLLIIPGAQGTGVETKDTDQLLTFCPHHYLSWFLRPLCFFFFFFFSFSPKATATGKLLLYRLHTVRKQVLGSAVYEDSTCCCGFKTSNSSPSLCFPFLFFHKLFLFLKKNLFFLKPWCAGHWFFLFIYLLICSLCFSHHASQIHSSPRPCVSALCPCNLPQPKNKIK